MCRVNMKRKQSRGRWSCLTAGAKMGSRGAADLWWAACWWQTHGDKRRLMQQGRSVDGPDWRVPHLVWSVCGQAVTSVWPNFETLYDGVWRDGTTLHFYPREQTAGPTHPLRVTAARRFQRPGNLFKLTRRVAERWTAPSHFLIIWMWVRARSPHSALQNGLRIVRKSPSHYGCKSDHGDGRKILWQLEGGNIALFQSKL